MGCGASSDGGEKYKADRRKSSIHDCGVSLERPPSDDGKVCDEPSPTYVKVRQMKNHLKGGISEAINRKLQGDSPPVSPSQKKMFDPLSTETTSCRGRKLILIVFSWLDTLPMEGVATPKGSRAFSDSEVFKIYDADEDLPAPDVGRLVLADIAPRPLSSEMQLKKLQHHIQKTVDLHNTTMYTEFRDPDSVPLAQVVGLKKKNGADKSPPSATHLTVPQSDTDRLSDVREEATTPVAPGMMDEPAIFCKEADFGAQLPELEDSPADQAKISPNFVTEELPPAEIESLMMPNVPSKGVQTSNDLAKLQKYIQATTDLATTTMYTMFRDPASVPLMSLVSFGDSMKGESSFNSAAQDGSDGGSADAELPSSPRAQRFGATPDEGALAVE